MTVAQMESLPIYSISFIQKLLHLIEFVFQLNNHNGQKLA